MKRVDKNLVGLEMLLDAGEVEDLLHHLDVVLEGIDHLEIGKSLFLVELACHLPELDGFGQHFQATVHF